ncbi:MAG: serine/threonine-protein kinase [Gemmataceae bacterium]
MEVSKFDLAKAGDYDLVEKVAEGGMGTVYKGRHAVSGEYVAVKVIPKHLAGNTVFLRRFEKEYNAAKALDHPNIVRALDFGREGDLPYLVMEFVEGESLGQRLERVGKLPEAEAIRIMQHVAQGLQKAHRLGLVHRDVKPDNILLTPDGQVKVTDLGLVKDADSDLNLTRTGRGLGTPHFMAPEQFRRAKDADARCDIYSMAATLYMMVTGELPFRSCGPLDAWMKKINNEIPSPRQLAPGLSERLDWAIRRSMSADPGQRAATCREFIEDLTGQTTRRIGGSATNVEMKDIWYLVYKDDDGVIHTVKGSTAGIRRSLKEGLLGDATQIRLSRSKEGPFEGLRQRPEFRDVLFDQRGAQPAGGNQRNRAGSAVGGFSGPVGLGETPLPDPRQTPLPEPAVRSSDALAPASGMLAASAILTPPRADASHAPHIALAAGTGSPEWVKWVGLILAAAAAGVAGYLLMPFLASWRLF